MNTFSGHILKAHVRPLLFGFALIMFVLIIDVMLQLMDQVLSKGLSPEEAGRLFFFNLAWIVALAVPMAVLIAVLMAFGRLAADNEIMAAKAAGMSFFHMLRPTLVAATALTLLMVWFNDQVLPDFNHKARNTHSNLKRRKAALVLKEKEGVFIHKLSNYSLLIRDVDEVNNRLNGITVYDAGGIGPPVTLHARTGEISLFDEGSYIRLSLEDGEYTRIVANEPESLVRGTFARQVIHIKDRDRALSQYSSSYRSDREMDISAMYQAVEKERTRRRGIRTHIDTLITNHLGMLASNAETESAAAGDSSIAGAHEKVLKKIQRENQRLRNHDGRINEYLVEIHKKFSIPVACIVFVLVGAPLGSLIRQRGAAVSVGVSLSFFLVYWMFLIGGEELADRGFISPTVAMWAPNVIFGAIGVALTMAIVQDWPFLWRRRRRDRDRGRLI